MTGPPSKRLERPPKAEAIYTPPISTADSSSDECSSMMLLPSGRSNSDVYPLQNRQKPIFVTRTSAPQLALTPPTSVSGVGPAAAEAPSSARAGDDFIASVQASTGKDTEAFSMSALSPGESESGIDQIATKAILSESSKATSPGSTTAAPTATPSEAALPSLDSVGYWQDADLLLETIQHQIRDGWTAHAGKDGRLYYCNHLTKTSSWLPPCEDWSCSEELPYGWERAVDSKGRPYYINHLNKTSTYEAPESVRWDEKRPEPRITVLQRSPTLGFGFVAGSERPVIVRFVTDGGPSMNKLQPGDQILAVNGEDVKEAPRDHVIQLVRACETQVTLSVSQPAYTLAPGRKSTLLSAGKRAKLRTRPSRVRFAESVCVNGAPLFPPSAFSLGDICVPPMANVLKVFLENGQTKSFKYDATTTVQDVVTSLLDKLCLSTGENFSLVLEHVKSVKRNKLTLLDLEESLARIAARPGAHKLRCLFRVTFMPISAADLAQKDLNALDYFYMQCCNDVTQERFAPELQPEVALRLAALHVHQHALAHNVCPAKLTVKIVEREFGLERFIPSTLFEGMKRKELRRLISHFLKLNAEMTGTSTKVLTQLQAKLHYLDIITSLPSYGAKCFSTSQREGVERVLLISPRFGLSQISSARNSVPQLISTIEDFSHAIVRRDDDVTCSVAVFMRGERVVKFVMEERDACEFSLVLAGYYRLITGKDLPVDRDRERCDEDNAPSYLAQHTVLPTSWSYLQPFHSRTHSMNFLMSPPYHNVELSVALKTNLEPGTTSNRRTDLSQRDCSLKSSGVPTQKPTNSKFLYSGTMDLDIHSVMATELLEEAKESGLNESSEGESNANDSSGENGGHSVEVKNEEVLRRVHEMQKMVENSEQYLTEQEEQLNETGTSEQRNSSNSDSWLNESFRNTSSASKQRTGIEFDSDCDSLNSSKISSTEDASQQPLKHSDSLVLLAEAINQDLSGIAQGLNSIGNGQHSSQLQPRHISRSPGPERKVDSFCQLLSNLHAVGNDCSQSESDSESVQSPPHSPTTRRPTLLQPNNNVNSKQMKVYRCSFGLHSPDGGNFGAETKDCNLKEYLKQLKEISKADDASQDTSMAAKKLSEIYGFEIHEDTFIETDSDLIDLRALPPPRTPDELDALSLLNAAPHGFADGSSKPNGAADAEEDLDRFLEKVVVGPPTQRTTPAKELTPEEIMSFIIPPPPNLELSERSREDGKEQRHAVIKSRESFPESESLYSNSTTIQCAETSKLQSQIPPRPQEVGEHSTMAHVIEYATVERKSKFSCCPKSKKEQVPPAEFADPSLHRSSIQVPPRRCTKANDVPPPARPPKSTGVISRYSPKKQPSCAPTPKPFQRARRYPESTAPEESPPMLPPRISPIRRSSNDSCVSSTASLAPKKPPLPPTSNRPSNQFRSAGKSPPSPFLNVGPPTQSHSGLPTSDKSNSLRTCHSTRPSLSLLCSPQMMRKSQNPSPTQYDGRSQPPPHTDKLIVKNGHVIDGEALLAKTDVAMTGLLVKLDQVAAQCSAAQAAGGGVRINEEKFQRARNELTEQTLVLVTASKFLVMAMSDVKLAMLLEHLTSCLTAIRRITELTEAMTCHTSAPLQTRNIVLKVHDVASSFRELVGVHIGPVGAGQLALQAECLANMLATLLRSLRVFSP